MNRLAATTSVLVLSVLGSYGCSSSQTSATPNGDADAGAPDAGPTLGSAREVLDLRVELGHQASTVYQNSYFFNVRAQPDERCGVKTSADCYVRDCRGTGTPAGALNAGTITISNTAGDLSYKLTPNSENDYLDVQSQDPKKIMEGDTFKVVAAGGPGLGAFTIEGQMPPVALKATPSTTVDRTQPFTFNWTPTEGTVSLGIMQGPAGGGSSLLSFVEIRCRVDAQAGTFSVPTELLSVLEAQSPVTGFSNTFFGLEKVQTTTVGTDRVSLGAFSYQAVKVAVH